jgi:hypothetical protein
MLDLLSAESQPKPKNLAFVQSPEEKNNSRLSFLKELLAVFAISIGLVICVVIITTRDTPELPQNLVTAHITRATELADNNMEFRTRLVSVRLCRSHKIAKNWHGRVHVLSQDCDSIYTDGGAASGGCGTDYPGLYSNLASVSNHQILVNMTKGGEYSHVSVVYEPVVRLSGNVLEPGNTRLYTKAVEFCGSSSFAANSDLSSNVSTNVANFDLKLMYAAERAEMHAFFKRPTAILSTLYAIYDLYGSVTGGPASKPPGAISDANGRWINAVMPSISAYTTSSIAASITQVWRIEMAQASATYSVASQCSTYDSTHASTNYAAPVDGSTISNAAFAGEVTISVVMHRSSVGETLGLSVATRSESNMYVYPMEVYSFVEDTGTITASQIMYDGTTCARIINLNTTGESATEAAMLIGANYFPLTFVQ